jgi:beta-galactosidase
MKDDDNTLWPQRQPGPLVDVLGERVEQYYALTDPVSVSGNWGEAQSELWAEMLSANSPETQVLMRYGKSNGWLDEQPAAITRKIGKGRITYVGAWLDPKTMSKAAAWMLQESNVKPVFGPALPEGGEVSVRYGENKKAVVILVNCTKSQQAVKLPGTMTDVLKGGNHAAVSLEPYGVAVLARGE